MAKEYKTAKLVDEYSKTTYLVLTGNKVFELFENKSNPDFFKFLKRKSIKSFALVTSDNPFSKQLSEKENAKRRKSLKILLKMLSVKFVKASSRPNTKNWKPELGYCIFNVDLKFAKNIGIIFEQNAIVYGTVNSKVKIFWC